MGRNGLLIVIAQKQRHCMVLFLLSSVKMGIWLGECNGHHCVKEAKVKV